MPRRCKADDWLLEPAEMVCEVRGVIRRRRLAPAPTRPTGDSTRRAPAGQAVCRSPSCVRGAAGVGFGVCAHSLCSDSRLLWDCPICGYLTILRVSIVHRERRDDRPYRGCTPISVKPYVTLKPYTTIEFRVSTIRRPYRDSRVCARSLVRVHSPSGYRDISQLTDTVFFHTSLTSHSSQVTQSTPGTRS